jgi:hypothetical protein
MNTAAPVDDAPPATFRAAVRICFAAIIGVDRCCSRSANRRLIGAGCRDMFLSLLAPCSRRCRCRRRHPRRPRRHRFRDRQHRPTRRPPRSPSRPPPPLPLPPSSSSSRSSSPSNSSPFSPSSERSLLSSALSGTRCVPRLMLARGTVKRRRLVTGLGGGGGTGSNAASPLSAGAPMPLVICSRVRCAHIQSNSISRDRYLLRSCVSLPRSCTLAQPVAEVSLAKRSVSEEGDLISTMYLRMATSSCSSHSRASERVHSSERHLTRTWPRACASRGAAQLRPTVSTSKNAHKQQKKHSARRRAERDTQDLGEKKKASEKSKKVREN